MIMRSLLLAAATLAVVLGGIAEARADTIRIPGDQGNSYTCP
jgi:hypothetical protein